MTTFDAQALPAANDSLAESPSRPFTPSAPPRAPKVRLITSEQLFADFPEVQIAHGDAIYRLRQTSLGKLILTK
jgi:hemin uptake protein HemP